MKFLKKKLNWTCQMLSDLEKNLNYIQVCAEEIVYLLTLPGCQKKVVLHEIEGVLEGIQKIRELDLSSK